jgi:hypothetical protein
LLIFFAFTIKEGGLPTTVFGVSVGKGVAIGVIGGALGAGTFLSTAVGTRLRIRRPVALQAGGLILVSAAAVLATLRFSLPALALLCLITAIASGLAKLAVDASIQEKINEHVRASAFAHAETVLMLAWVAGGAVGLIPVGGRIGVGIAAGFATLAALRAGLVAGGLRKDRLRGRSAGAVQLPPVPATITSRGAAAAADTRSAETSRPGRRAPRRTAANRRRSADVAPAAEPASRKPISPAPPLAPPGYHIYRPTADPGEGDAPGASEDGSRQGRGPKG